MLEAALAAGVAGEGGDALRGGGAADAGGVDPRPPARTRPRRRRLRLAQPVARQRDQVLRRRRTQARRRRRGQDRGARSSDAAPVDAPRSASIGRVRALEGGLDDYLRELERAFPLDLSGLKLVLDCANGATYRAAPAIFRPARRRGRGDRRRARTGATSTRAAARPTPRRSPSGSRRAARRSASPSTATATGCSRSTRPARSATATS